MSEVKTCKDIHGGSGQAKKDPPPMQRVKEEATINPCSGRYEGGENGISIKMKVDVDKLNMNSTELHVVSGTISVPNAGDGPWSSDAVSIYFSTLPFSVKYSGGGTDSREIVANIKATFSNGVKAGGDLSVKLTNNRGWKAQVDIAIDGQPKLSFKSLERISTFFKDVNIDIDYTEKVTWPIVELDKLSSQPAGMEKRKIDAFSAFEDAGLKLHFDEAKNSELVLDPSPETPWTKSDLYDVMMNFFDEGRSDDNIWCMMGTTPPDKRYMGFSFDKNGKHGFALFTGHTSFIGLDSDSALVKAEAQRRLLHYMVHECGHCLGLKHPFEIGAPDSLSWMNYAWRYDVSHDPGSFYDNFKYRFSDQELMILRHSPGKEFTSASSPQVLVSIMGKGYRVKTDVPDLKLADDDSDNDDEEELGSSASKHPKYSKTKAMRKIVLDLKIQPEAFIKGQLFSFEARIKNVGKLPVLIEGDLSLESGNLQLYLTDPDGNVQVINPFVRPIQSGFSRPCVLFTPEDEEGLDRYSELVIVGEASQGYQFNAVGKYELRAVYSGGRYKVTSASYPVTIVDDDDDSDDDETRNQLYEAATLQSSNWSRFKKVQEFWKKAVSKGLDYKKKHLTALISVMEGLCKESIRQVETASKSKKTRSSKGKLKLSKGKPILKAGQLLSDTADVLKYYQKEGKKSDNQTYSKLVLTRCKLALLAGKTQEADIEFNQMFADLVTRHVKYQVLQKLSKIWNKLKIPVDAATKMTPEYLQKKVNAVLTWAPTTDGNGEPDLSGIGIGNPFSNFDVAHMKLAVKIAEMLFTKFDETNNLRAVISYADKLQKGREVNYMVLRWALEAFIVHSMAAKRAGIKYPEPDDKDQSVLSDAAMVVTQRTGLPTENWLNYWRSDADLNYHHRHFHVVYNVGNFLRRDANGNPVISTTAPSHLHKQGEMFGYMHAQVLARYDAERESWGLQPVQQWGYRERAMTFNAGFEFHNDTQFRSFVPRPNTVWPAGAIRQFQIWQSAYENALQTGVVAPGVELTPNWAGHIIEASSQLYSERFGSIHNAGHGVFGSTGIPERSTSYMNSTSTAMRDSIFYRWHKKIDNLWQSNNDYYRVELAHDGPPVTITSDDIIIGSSPQPPAGFAEFESGEWVSKAPAETTTLKTYLGPPLKKFEWDNKLSHDKFYYHVRVKRNPGAQGRNINLTARIFICPKSRQTERKRWIEMDKFVFRIDANEDHINLTRADRHSSVIKRLPKDMQDDFEQNFVQSSRGFCECGWPYTMLLPRGKKEGEEYVVFVILTNNDIDNIGLRTTCGSLSYCGARGEEYPDSRNMGYPFSNPITLRGRRSQIPEVFDEISNAAYKTFIIQNNVSEPPPNPARDIWYPHMQLGLNDGSLGRDLISGVTELVQSDLVGFFRVLVDADAAQPSQGSTLLIRFQGRGEGGGAYTIRDVTLGLRSNTTINVVTPTADVTYKGAKEFSVPEQGLISDRVNLRLNPALGDYFITFALESPGVYLPSSQRSQTSTYFIRATPGSQGPVPSQWSSERIDGRYPHIHCISSIMTEMSS